MKAWWRKLHRWVAAVSLAVLLHAALMQGLKDVWTAFDAAHPPMQRMQAAYTRSVQLSVAPEVRRTLPPPPARGVAPAPPASASTDRAETTAEATLDAMPPWAASGAAEGDAADPASASGSASAAPAAASAPPAVASAGFAPPPPAAAASDAIFEWPRATRIRYRLEGQYRGEVTGSATVEWLRQDQRYQVHLDVSAAGIFTRRMSSEGHLTAAGLVPERYVQTTALFGGLFANPRVEEMTFGGPTVRLLNGQEVPTLPLLQDTASQFIQFIYLLTTQPASRQTGSTFDVALALPRSARVWRYEVAPDEEVDTPAGPVSTLHLRPASSAPAGDWTVEMWFAPRLQMLPVRFRIRQNAEVSFDLFIDQLPEQAAR